MAATRKPRRSLKEWAGKPIRAILLKSVQSRRARIGDLQLRLDGEEQLIGRALERMKEFSQTHGAMANETIRANFAKINLELAHLRTQKRIKQEEKKLLRRLKWLRKKQDIKQKN